MIWPFKSKTAQTSSKGKGADLFEFARSARAEQLLAHPEFAPDARTTNQMTLLQTAISEANDGVASALIDRGVPLDARDQAGRSALHYAAAWRNWPMLRRLIAAGADVNLADGHGNGPLWTTIMSAAGEFAAVADLIQAGARPDQINRHGASPRTLAESFAVPELADMFARAPSATDQNETP